MRDRSTAGIDRKTLSHRGPDGFGECRSAESGVYMAHWRLAIQGLNFEGSQPFVCGQTGVTMVFNGEIYNYKDIDAKFGFFNLSHSDTETLLNLYLREGINFLEYVEGIFAIGIYDPRRKELLLVRDRFGVKPLYFRSDESGVRFSSEIKAIAAPQERLNIQVTFDYFENDLLCHSNETFFQNIKSVSQGQIVKVDLMDFKVADHQYWTLSPYEKAMSEVQDDKALEHALGRAVKYNFVADVDVGICLSSGLDSSLLLHLAMKQGLPLNAGAFGFGFKNSEYDESHEAKEYAQICGAGFRSSVVDQNEFLDLLREAIFFFESPLGGLGTLSSYKLMKLVRHHNCKVLVSGEGADELFGGYSYYHALENGEVRLGGVLAPDGSRSFALPKGPLFEGIEGSLNKDQFSGSVDECHIKARMRMDLFKYKLPKLLHFQDRSGMSSGVEIRVPFLFSEVVESAWALPHNHILNDKLKLGKLPLRRMLAHSSEFYSFDRPKHAVQTPQREWLKDSNTAERVLEEIRFGKLTKLGIIDFNKVHKLYREYANSEILGNSSAIWKIINLEYFLSEFRLS